MRDLTLFHCPGACSQVTLCALEQSGLPFSVELVNLARGEQTGRFADRLPMKKVPTLLINGRPLTENAAILMYIANECPDAGLFPDAKSSLARAERYAGLSFCGATLHPIVRGIANPQRLTTDAVEPVRARAIELAASAFRYAEERLETNNWWLSTPSIVDVYLNWAFATARDGGFDPTPFPRLSVLASRLMERPAFASMMRRESSARAQLGL